MSSEVDGVGSFITGGLVARQFDSPPGRHAAHAGEAQHACPNCDAEIHGHYCHMCGQHAHLPRSIGHIFEELVHGVLHLDSKFWRTLPMLIARPGQLTRDYVQGKRARYVAPFAFFLFTVFAMYFTFAFIGAPDFTAMPPMSTTEVEEAEAELAAEQAELETLEARAAELAADPDASEIELADLRSDIAITRAALDMARRAVASARVEADSEAAEAAADAPPDWKEALRDAAAEDENFGDGIGSPAMRERVRAAMANPELTFYKIQQSAYKFSFLLVPLSLPFVWLLFFWKRGVRLYDHTVFILYSLSFMTLLFILLSLGMKAGLFGIPLASTLLVFVPPVHMYVQLKGAYGLGRFGATWRTIMLASFSIAVLTIFFMLISAMGALG